MRIDFSPLYRSTVGFDRLFSLMDAMGAGETSQPSYPPYNIERTGENAYRISMAVAGFGEADLALEVKEGVLAVKGDKAATEENKELLYRGIASRSFERRFQLADHVVVQGAKLENGLLHIDLVREVPEAMKPRRIPITAPAAAKTIEAPANTAAPTVEAA
jgi:molecular chaperone IbpA